MDIHWTSSFKNNNEQRKISCMTNRNTQRKNRRTKTQLEKIMNALSTGRHLTRSEAEARLGINRLSARIYDLRQEGFTIYTNKIKSKKTGTKVFGYRLATPEQILWKQLTA